MNKSTMSAKDLQRHEEMLEKNGGKNPKISRKEQNYQQKINALETALSDANKATQEKDGMLKAANKRIKELEGEVETLLSA